MHVYYPEGLLLKKGNRKIEHLGKIMNQEIVRASLYLEESKGIGVVQDQIYNSESKKRAESVLIYFTVITIIFAVVSFCSIVILLLGAAMLQPSSVVIRLSHSFSEVDYFSLLQIENVSTFPLFRCVLASL